MTFAIRTHTDDFAHSNHLVMQKLSLDGLRNLAYATNCMLNNKEPAYFDSKFIQQNGGCEKAIGVGIIVGEGMG